MSFFDDTYHATMISRDDVIIGGDDVIIGVGGGGGVSVMAEASTFELKDECEKSLFFFLVYGPICGLICALGLVGNSLSFAIMHKYSRDSVATFLLKVRKGQCGFVLP